MVSTKGEEAAMTDETRSSHQVFPFQQLDVYRAARSLAELVHRAGIRDAELRDQATRAAKSAFLALSEGLPSDRVAIRRQYFERADGSVHEVAGALDLARVIDAMDAREAAALIELAARLRAMVRGLLRSTGKPR